MKMVRVQPIVPWSQNCIKNCASRVVCCIKKVAFRTICAVIVCDRYRMAIREVKGGDVDGVRVGMLAAWSDGFRVHVSACERAELVDAHKPGMHVRLGCLLQEVLVPDQTGCETTGGGSSRRKDNW